MMVRSSTRIVALATMALLAIMLTGCSTPPKREAMAPQGLLISSHFPQSVHVQTAGGAATSAVSGTNISDVDLKIAIENAIAQNKVFKSIVQTTDADYELNVSIVSLSKPFVGLTFDVDMEAAWSLTKQADHSVVLRKSVKSRGTATVGDAFVAVTRLRLAVENAARDNISQGLKALAELKL